MRSLRSAWQVCLHNLIRLLTSSRFFVLLLSSFAVYAYVILPLVDLGKEMNEPINALEPFIALGNPRLLVFLYGAVIMLLFCDVPIMEDSHNSLIIRMSRRSWLGGQIFYIVLTSFLWVGMIFLFTVLVVAPRSFWANEWSYVINTLAYNRGLKIQIHIWAYVNANIVSNITPWAAALHNYLLLSLYAVCIGLLVLLVNLRHTRALSVIVVLAVNIEGYMAMAFVDENHPLRIFLTWIAPFHHAWLDQHNFTNRWGFSPAASYAFFLLLNTVLALIALARVKRIDLLPDTRR